MPGRADVLVVSIDSTGGWRTAAEELVAGLRRAGAAAELIRTGPVPRVRTFALTDYTRRAWLAGSPSAASRSTTRGR